MLSLSVLRMRTVIALIVFNSLAAAFDVFDFVDPLIGTLNGGMASTTSSAKNASNITQGHVFPGATLPYGKSPYRCPSPLARS